VQRRIVSRDNRNRRIGDFLKELDLTEGRGTGFPTIYRVMEKNGSPEPIFETDESCTYFLSVLPANATFVEKEQASVGATAQAVP
jgi:ATP-dependent DNA helicase RecG